MSLKTLYSRKNNNENMSGIYEAMKKDWKIYCLMAGIALIEEMKKPTLNIQRKKREGVLKRYNCFHTIRFKMKDKDSIIKWLEITRSWEEKLNKHFLGESFKEYPHQEGYSGQWYIIFSPQWLYEVMKTVGRFPSKYTNDICLKRIRNIRPFTGKRKIPENGIKEIKNRSLYNKLFLDKFLAAGAFIVSFDLEFRGVSMGIPSLCMTTKYEDFLEFMLNLAQKWGWTGNTRLSNVDLQHSFKRGIKATPKKEFRLTIKSLEDIYNLAGPLMDTEKNKFIRFHIERYNKPYKAIKGRAKNKIIEVLKNEGPLKSTLLQIPTGVRVDVILGHLKDLEKMKLVEKERRGKFYLWRYIGE